VKIRAVESISIPLVKIRAVGSIAYLSLPLVK
jgi:hypothetical protein